MKQKTRRLPLGFVWVIVTVLAIGIAVFVTAYRAERATRDYRHQVYADEVDCWKQEYFRKFLRSIGTELTVPATDGEELTFTSPKAFTMQERFNKETDVKKGETLSCDFISWSGDRGGGERHVMLRYDGKLREVTIPYKLAAKLYIAALEQNGLSEQFRQETGEKLGYRSAREALRGIDRQIFELGLYIPRDYPYDRAAFDGLILLTGGSVSLILLVLLAVLPQLIEYLRYQAFLVEYNKESSRRWRDVEGKLPQFVSLQENADGGKPIPVYQPPGFVKRLKKMFSPVVRE